MLAFIFIAYIKSISKHFVQFDDNNTPVKMKTEISWKRRFLRKRIKYMLLCVAIVGVIFVVHQIFYLKELNKAIVGKLITGSVKDSHIAAGNVHSKWNEPRYSKLIRDKNGQTVSLRGTRNEDISKYLPNVRGKFVCFKSRKEIEFNQINDDYCDCPLDGSDEPGTNACNNGIFNCETSSLKFTAKISSYKVNDGYCDCCDGSDEWIGVSYTLNESKDTSHKQTKCANFC